MAKSKTSKAAITKVLDEVEAELKKCWGTLAAIKEGPYDERYAYEMIHFQSILAPALFRLNESYLSLAHAKRLAVTRKRQVNSEWFRIRMRSIAKYQASIKIAISIAKALGDSFAWMFYQKDRNLLTKHLERERLDHTPPGIGGRGELEFIKQVRQIDGDLVLYHGITTFLRLGDISLIDLGTQSVRALGELKTKKVGSDRIEISFECVSPKPFPKSNIPRATTTHESKRNMPPEIEKKLNRQLKIMAGQWRSQRST